MKTYIAYKYTCHCITRIIFQCQCQQLKKYQIVEQHPIILSNATKTENIQRNQIANATMNVEHVFLCTILQKVIRNSAAQSCDEDAT